MVHENNFKYLSAPTIEQIESVVKAVGVSEAQFERYYNLYDGAITHVRIGFRQLPAHYWHIFFEPQKLTNKKANPKPAETPIQRTKLKKSGRISGLLD